MPRISDELLELENGLLSRYLNPYSKLSLDSIQKAAANVKMTSKVSMAIKESIKIKKRPEDEEEDEHFHQLQKIFTFPHLEKDEMYEKFLEIFEDLTTALQPIGHLDPFGIRITKGFELLEDAHLEEQERVDTWLLEAAEDATYLLLKRLKLSSLRNIVGLIKDEIPPYFSHLVQIVRNGCKIVHGDDGVTSTISYLKGLRQKWKKKTKLIQFQDKRGEEYNEKFDD